jgi:transcriptional regulator CtsR
MFGLFQSPKLSHKAVHIIKYLVSSSHQTVTQNYRDYLMFGFFQSPKLTHKAVHIIKCLASSSHQNCHTKLYLLTNFWSILVNKTVTQSCRVYQMFGFFQLPKLTHKDVNIIKCLFSSSQQNCHKKLYRISNVWSLLVTNPVTHCCTEYQIFDLF